MGQAKPSTMPRLPSAVYLLQDPPPKDVSVSLSRYHINRFAKPNPARSYQARRTATYLYSPSQVVYRHAVVVVLAVAGGARVLSRLISALNPSHASWIFMFLSNPSDRFLVSFHSVRSAASWDVFRRTLTLSASSRARFAFAFKRRAVSEAGRREGGKGQFWRCVSSYVHAR